jgi:hypothetical protein
MQNLKDGAEIGIAIAMGAGLFALVLLMFG